MVVTAAASEPSSSTFQYVDCSTEEIRQASGGAAPREHARQFRGAGRKLACIPRVCSGAFKR